MARIPNTPRDNASPPPKYYWKATARLIHQRAISQTHLGSEHAGRTCSNTLAVCLQLSLDRQTEKEAVKETMEGHSRSKYKRACRSAWRWTSTALPTISLLQITILKPSLSLSPIAQDVLHSSSCSPSSCCGFGSSTSAREPWQCSQCISSPD